MPPRSCQCQSLVPKGGDLPGNAVELICYPSCSVSSGKCHLTPIPLPSEHMTLISGEVLTFESLMRLDMCSIYKRDQHLGKS